MNKSIFLLFEGIPSTVFESQVLAHVRRMKTLGYVFEIWSFSADADNHRRSEINLKRLDRNGITIRLFRGVPAYIPCSEVINAIQLAVLLIRFGKGVSLIHARTEYAASIAGLVKFVMPFRLVWDARGDTETEYAEYFASHSMVKKLIIPYRISAIRTNLWIASKRCEAAIFVSEALQQRQGTGIRAKTTVIPSVTDASRFYFSAEVRKMVRNKLGFGPEDKVLIFSGSSAPWQCFTESAELFRSLLARDSEHCKWIILTKEVIVIRNHINGIPERALRVVSADLYGVNDYLNAADFGMLLRQENLVNFVASPVKFAEYCLAGLPVIMGKAVKQSFQIAQILGNLVMYDADSGVPTLSPFNNKLREITAIQARAYFDRSSIDGRYAELYSVEPK